MRLDELREKIDLIDNQILKLLIQRSDWVKKVNVVKEAKDIHNFSPAREADILRRIKKLNKKQMSDADIEIIFKEILSVFRAMQGDLRIAYLGPQGTFTHLAAVKRFGKKVEYIACDSINEVFDAVEKERADYGVVPIENSIEGVVTYTLDMFFESALKICSEVTMDIHHNLLTSYPRNKILRIYSHPQVLAQCRNWLAKNFPKTELVPVLSTARAASEAKKDNHGACIGNKILASLYDLKMLSPHVQDVSSNITRFLIIAQNESNPSRSDKTSILFSVKDKAGALYEALQPFKKYRINLTKIESRPSKKKAWEYYFFVDFEGHQGNPLIKKTIKELQARCSFVKILGSYPKEN
ncbi:MAG: prephenate dehydratase [Candidatus Omnitrophica bacterium]|nr:prephenate dehydratase [Candidatus Omnitrophota bacterium]